MDTPSAPQFPAEFTIGGRTYELVPFLKEGESSVKGDTMVERAKELNANLSEEDGQFILRHQNEIPSEYGGKLYLVFTGWRDPSDPQDVGFLPLVRRGDRWHRYFGRLDSGWCENVPLVRRKT